MSRTYHHNARRDLYIMVPETGYFACQWTALAKRFMKHHVRRLQRRYAQKELRKELQDACAPLSVPFTHQFYVLPDYSQPHNWQDKFCCCDECVRKFNARYDYNGKNDLHGAPICEFCGYAYCMGNCPSADAHYEALRWEQTEQEFERQREEDARYDRENSRTLVPLKIAHEFDDDAVCVRCGFDGAEHWHWSHNTYEGVAAREAGEAGMPNCVQVYESH